MKEKKKKRRGLVFMLLGGLLLAGALGLTAFNIWDENRAEESVAEIIQQVAQEVPEIEERDFSAMRPIDLPVYRLVPRIEMPTTVVDNNRYIGILEVPTLGLSLPVMSDWSYPKLRIAPCRFSGSAYTNDLVICAHNYQTHFGPLNQLLAGDEVRFTDMDGNLFLYEVAETEILQPTDVAEMLDDTWDLTLFTCTYGGQTRFTVRCLSTGQG